MRNHAFLYTGPDGWRLAPAYDLNPVPTDIKPRVLTTVIDLDDGSASLDLAMSVVGYFELDENKAHVIAAEVGQAKSMKPLDPSIKPLTESHAPLYEAEVHEKDTKWMLVINAEDLVRLEYVDLFVGGTG